MDKVNQRKIVRIVTETGKKYDPFLELENMYSEKSSDSFSIEGIYQVMFNPSTLKFRE